MCILHFVPLPPLYVSPYIFAQFMYYFPGAVHSYNLLVMLSLFYVYPSVPNLVSFHQRAPYPHLCSVVAAGS